MVGEIYNIKNEILEQVKKELSERGAERMNVERMGAMVDMVKDLAEAEASCWEAEYHKIVTEAMQKGSMSGYGSGGGTGSSAGYGSMQSGGRSGYSSQGMNQGYGSMRQGYGSSMGHVEVMEPLRMAIQNAGPDEREHLRNEVLKTIGAM